MVVARVYALLAMKLTGVRARGNHTRRHHDSSICKCAFVASFYFNLHTLSAYGHKHLRLTSSCVASCQPPESKFAIAQKFLLQFMKSRMEHSMDRCMGGNKQSAACDSLGDAAAIISAKE